MSNLRWVAVVSALVVSACSSAPQDGDTGAIGESDDHLLAGRHLTTAEVAAALRDAGFPESVVGPMVCTAKYESSFYERASHYNANGSTDYGLFQINSIHIGDSGCPSTASGLYDAAANARCAHAVWRSQGINAWYGYQKHRAECAATRAPAASDQPAAPDDPSASDGASDPYAQEDAGSCWSGTLQDMETPGTCVQSKYDGDWYQCRNGAWYASDDSSTCTSSHPLQ